ncbi:MAG: hypothetical protein MZU97_03975 [Bacillus subtilis]|nr:hypothetical protein [Bacillus subtilis]
MRSLTIKRIIMFFCLLAAIAVLSIYRVVMAQVANSESIERFINSRKQKQDYTALFSRQTFKSFTIEFDQAAFDALILDMETYFALYGTYRDNIDAPGRCHVRRFARQFLHVARSRFSNQIEHQPKLADDNRLARTRQLPSDFVSTSIRRDPRV